MAMTKTEGNRLIAAERALNQALNLLNAVGSKNQLNRLHILLSRELDRMENTMDNLETETSKVLELARKVQ